jgi:hypothetical protein
MLAIAYGTKVEQQNDSRIIFGEQVADYLSESLTPISILADAIPFLVPLISPFLPKAAFSKSKAEWSDIISRFRNDLFVHAQTLVVSYFSPSFPPSKKVVEIQSRRTGWWLKTLWYRVP